MRRQGFTLIELIVVMGIITVVAGVTVIAVRALAKDARLASASNTVEAALGNARALAMRKNKPILLVFRARWDSEFPQQRQVTEVLLAESTGEFGLFGSASDPQVKERFVAVADVPARQLPPGIKVAGPWYEFSADATWITQPELRNTIPNDPTGETPGRMIGVMFGPNGDLLTRNPQNDTAQIFVDFNNNGVDDIGSNPPNQNDRFFVYDEPIDEVNVLFVPFLAVYDDDAAREMMGDDDWQYGGQWFGTSYHAELTDGDTGYISRFNNPVIFNRYTGVVLKQ